MQIFECVHAVAGVDVELLQAGPAPALRNLIGTSFHLGGQRFMSAAHVLREVERYPLRAITYFVGPEIRFAPVSEIEYAEHLDIGVFRALKYPTRRHRGGHFAEKRFSRASSLAGFRTRLTRRTRASRCGPFAATSLPRIGTFR